MTKRGRILVCLISMLAEGRVGLWLFICWCMEYGGQGAYRRGRLGSCMSDGYMVWAGCLSIYNSTSYTVFCSKYAMNLTRIYPDVDDNPKPARKGAPIVRKRSTVTRKSRGDLNSLFQPAVFVQGYMYINCQFFLLAVRQTTRSYSVRRTFVLFHSFLIHSFDFQSLL